MTAKEELFVRGAEAAGWSPVDQKNVTEPGYRLQPNAARCWNSPGKPAS